MDCLGCCREASGRYSFDLPRDRSLDRAPLCEECREGLLEHDFVTERPDPERPPRVA